MEDQLNLLTEKVNQLSATVESQGEMLESTMKENVQLKKTVASLSGTGTPEAKKKPTIPKETFNVEGVEYKFRVATIKTLDRKTRLPITVTATDALSDPDFLRSLVQIKSQAIVPFLDEEE